MTRKTSKELRKFGLTMAAACAILGGVFVWRQVSAWPYLFGVSAFFAAGGLIIPKILIPIEWIWMKIAHALGIVMTYILLTATFYVVITPLGFAMRIFGNDPMKRKFEKGKSSYWVAVDPEGPTSRPEKPY